MIPYVLPEKYKIIKIEKKIADETFTKISKEENYVVTVKIFHEDEEGDPTTTKIRINGVATRGLEKLPFDQLIFENLRIGTYKDNFYFKASKIVAN